MHPPRNERTAGTASGGSQNLVGDGLDPESYSKPVTARCSCSRCLGVGWLPRCQTCDELGHDDCAVA
jgi:hypothetical protein